MSQNKIRILDEQTINQIAAGEVIENPASVVKELVENCLDAQATKICVEIQEGGRQLIRVSDDGNGMTRDDALLCLERHATSKIQNIHDIQTIYTMGFRGEAIPSIASISHFSLLTTSRVSPTQAGEGTLVKVEGGKILSCTQAARAFGTTIEVKSLFFNVPVRRKFQKSPAIDVQDILKMLTLLSLGYPTIQFELLSDQKLILKTLGSSSQSFPDLLKQRIETVLDKEIHRDLIAVNFQQSPFELEGYIGRPTLHKPNKTGQYLFINQRAIYSPLISAAIREGYGTTLPANRYPLFILHLRLPGSLIDVNVHPQKREVRVRQEQQLRNLLIDAVQAALRQEPKYTPQELAYPYPAMMPSFFPSTPVVSEEPWVFQTLSAPSMAKFEPCYLPTSLPIQAPLLSPSSSARVLLTLFNYFIVESFYLDTRLFGSAALKKEGGLALIDQKAAYARITYERLLKQTASEDIQPLLIPLTLQFSLEEGETIKSHLSLLQQLGFGLKDFGNCTFALDFFPKALKEEHVQSCLKDLIQELIETQNVKSLQLKKEERLAQVACRSSLSSNKKLDLEEAHGLFQRLLKCDMPSVCPLGQQIALYLSPDDLIKLFQKGSV